MMNVLTAAPPPDPDFRQLLEVRRRALIQELNALERYLGMEPTIPPKKEREAHKQRQRRETDATPAPEIPRDPGHLCPQCAGR